MIDPGLRPGFLVGARHDRVGERGKERGGIQEGAVRRRASGALLAGKLLELEVGAAEAVQDLHPHVREEIRIQLAEVQRILRLNPSVACDPSRHGRHRPVRESPHLSVAEQGADSRDGVQALMEPGPPVAETRRFAVDHQPAVVCLRVVGIRVAAVRLSEIVERQERDTALLADELRDRGCGRLLRAE